MDEQQLIRNFPKALLSWYPLKENASVLFLKNGIEKLLVLQGILQDAGCQVVQADMEEVVREVQCGEKAYDYILLPGTLEVTEHPVRLLEKLKHLLSADGKMLIYVRNRLGIGYFCGEKDPYTHHIFDGIENYSRVNIQKMFRDDITGRMYSHAELEKVLEKAGLAHWKFYSVMPRLERPHMLIAEGYIPNELLDTRIFPEYDSPQTVFLEEENLYQSLLENGMFHAMANGYFIECAKKEELLLDFDEITVQEDRPKEEAMATLVKAGDYVVKKPLYPQGRHKCNVLMENTTYLLEHKVPMVAGRLIETGFEMPYVEGVIATEYFRDLLKRDKEVFLQELDQYVQWILNSSEPVPYQEVNWQRFEPGWQNRKEDDPNMDKWEELAFGSEVDRQNIGVILKRGYIDLVSINSFYTKEGIQFFDQEFYVENLPANVITLRTIDFIYGNCQELERICSKEELLSRYHLSAHADVWRRICYDFMEKLKYERELRSYHKQSKRDYSSLTASRQRMDYAPGEYEKLFRNIFKDVECKKVFLFGSGVFAKRFIEEYAESISIAGIFDNNKMRWEQELSGIPILNPAMLEHMQEPVKVYICMKDYDVVLKQLREYGIKDLAIYNPHLEYERPTQITVVRKQEEKPKKYHIGYIAGVFDLFHIGHLNLLRRAKEQCDYLIVGVVSDEQVIQNKKTSPYIPFTERREIVQSCKYVDEAVALPYGAADTEDAYRRYHFDVQFSGSDYATDPVWLAKQTYLRQQGAELVFFPYTESTSSTKLKKAISKRGV